MSRPVPPPARPVLQQKAAGQSAHHLPPPVRWPGGANAVQRKASPETGLPPVHWPGAGGRHFGRLVQCMNNEDEEKKLEIAAHNWQVVLGYGDAGSQIEKAFLKNGFNTNNVGSAILQAIIDKGYAKKKLAHYKGNKSSGRRGGTDEAILKCRDAILEWLSEQ